MRVKIQLDQWCIQSELIMEVDQSLFTEEIAKRINTFWSQSESRYSDNDEDHVKAALRLIAAEAFFLVGNNSFLNAEYVEHKFNWETKDQGIEGFPSFKDMGIEITDIEVWHLNHDMTEIVSIENDIREKKEEINER